MIPIKIRITYQNNKVDRSSGLWIPQEQWNAKKQRVKGNSDSAKKVNESIEGYLAKLSVIFRGYEQETNIHLPSIMDKLFVTAGEEPTLLKLMTEHIDELKLRVNKDFAYSTYEKYVFTFNKVKAFIEGSLKKRDILLKDITTRFIMEFDHYLRVTDNNQHNTAVKYCINLKRILNVAVMKGIMPNNPLKSFKTVYKDTEQLYLSESEVKAIEKAELVKPSHHLVRDLFLFQCSTGLAYTDMVNLAINDISTDNNGNKWIIKARQKSGIVSTIPLLPMPWRLSKSITSLQIKVLLYYPIIVFRNIISI